MPKSKVIFILFLILVAAAILRLYRIDLPDVINDEVFYGYRSIGLIDSLNSPFQPTPFEWHADSVPGWASLSFHDHPPLGFWIQHGFFSVFGASLFAMRLPFVLAGLLSVWLTYLIARGLFQSEKIGLLSAGLLAVSGYHVWISRTGLQESLVIFFILLSVWLFLKSLAEDKYFYPTVASIGVAILMKYTAVVLIPVFLIFWIWKRRDTISWRRVLAAGVLLIIILLPVLIYNFSLFADRGHFDFQLSFLLGQDVEEWKVRPGREVGGFIDKAQNLFVGYWQNAGIIFSVLTVVGLIGAWFNRRDKSVQFLLLAFSFLLLLLLVIGPQERFLAMLVPFLAILAAATIVNVSVNRKYLYALFAVLFAVELIFAVNTYHTVIPKGQEGISYSYLRRDSSPWGYNQLEEWFEKETNGFYPAVRLPLRFAFARDLQQAAVASGKDAGLVPRSILFISDSQIHGMSSLWYLTRHTVYDGWTIISENAYLSLLEDDPNFFVDQGFDEFVFIKTGDTLLRSDIESRADELEAEFTALGLNPEIILSPQGREAFKIYKF